MDQEKIGKFILKLRKELGWTQAQSAEKLGTSIKTISRWETGVTSIDSAYIPQLCKMYNITETELFNCDRIKSKKKSKYKKNILFAIIIAIISLLLIVLLFVFKNNYNNCFIYSIKSGDKNYLIEGNFISTSDNNILSITSIKNVKNFDIDNEKLYTYEFSLKSNDYLIYREGNIMLYEHDDYDILYSINSIIENIKIYIEEKNNYDKNIDKNNLKNLILNITYLDENLKKNELNIPIDLYNIYSNKKIFY